MHRAIQGVEAASNLLVFYLCPRHDLSSDLHPVLNPAKSITVEMHESNHNKRQRQVTCTKTNRQQGNSYQLPAWALERAAACSATDRRGYGGFGRSVGTHGIYLVRRLHTFNRHICVYVKSHTNKSAIQGINILLTVHWTLHFMAGSVRPKS